VCCRPLFSYRIVWAAAPPIDANRIRATVEILSSGKASQSILLQAKDGLANAAIEWLRGTMNVGPDYPIMGGSASCTKLPNPAMK
jgi:hypothetical protein